MVGSPDGVISSDEVWTYLPIKKNEGSRANRGITKERDRRFKAQSRRIMFMMDNGTNINPSRDNPHAFAGFMNTEPYDTTKSPATISISTRDVNPKNLFLAIL